jgi:hypothetical protein
MKMDYKLRIDKSLHLAHVTFKLATFDTLFSFVILAFAVCQLSMRMHNVKLYKKSLKFHNDYFYGTSVVKRYFTGYGKVQGKLAKKIFGLLS